GTIPKTGCSAPRKNISSPKATISETASATGRELKDCASWLEAAVCSCNTSGDTTVDHTRLTAITQPNNKVPIPIPQLKSCGVGSRNPNRFSACSGLRLKNNPMPSVEANTQ